MLTHISLRLRLIALGGGFAAVWLAWGLAQGDYVLPALVAALVIVAVSVRLLRTDVAAVALALILFGYLVGNRGFAQLMPVPGLPLLPAEIALLVAGGWIFLQCASAHRLPFRKDALNWAILAWLLVGTIRVMFDVRTYGLLAIRDYAMIYYAAFFFLAQELARDARSRGFLLGTLKVASFTLPFAVVLSEAFPGFFQTIFTVRGIPLIFFKGDLALTFMAVSGVFLATTAPVRHRPWLWVLALVEIVYVIGADNRASMLGALGALLWLAVSRLRRFVLLQGAAVLLAGLVVAGLALLADNLWARGKLAGVSERVLSLGDVVGSGTYVSAESSMKGDNNRFRTVWWGTVASETLSQNPFFGLGFGYDLSREFLQEYNPDMAEDFSARSPHSIIMSAFGRMGFAGLAAFLAFAFLLTRRTWRVMRDPDATPADLGLWSCAWVILISACFGVVLEGPMGAVVFWSLLGLASTPPEPVVTEADGAPAAPAEVPSLPSPLASAPLTHHRAL
ncbi:MAG: O-antigen ligase family protein [Verrucomicrobia bacterium]|nr:O-antigen ligase family protein [Verrucomicrobiota bacterium]